MHTDLLIARSLTRRYVAALTLIALLATAAWLSLHLVISEQKSSAALVNVSGRQRMLSQRTALFSTRLVYAEAADRPAIRRQLQDAVSLMQRSHQGLIQGDAELGLPASMSPAMRSLYFEEPLALNQQVEDYLKAAQALLQLPDASLYPQHPLLQYIVTVAPTRLVTSLDKAVSQYQAEGEAAVARLQVAETGVWLLTLALLLTEAAFIFQPFARQIRIVIGKLQAATERLRQSQDELEERVRQRTAALEQKTKELAESEEKFRLISTSAQDAILIIDQAEAIVYWNPAATKLFGYEADQVVGRNLHELLAPARYQADIRRGYDHFRQSGSGPLIGKTLEVMALHKEGHELPIELSISTLPLNGQIHALGIIRDISERKRAQARDHLLVAALEAVGNGVVITDPKARIEWTNSAFQSLTGYSLDEALGHRPAELVKSGQQGPAFYQNLWETILAGHTWHGELINKRKDGSLYDEELIITPVRDETQQIRHFVAIKQDVSARKKMETQLRESATTDFLTGLSNRRHFMTCMDEQLARVQRQVIQGAAVLMADLDHFKRINDTYGHGAGDALLCHVAGLMREGLRQVDCLGRIGGEEFALILPGTSWAGAQVLAERLRQTVAATPFNHQGQLIGITVSIGVSVMLPDDVSAGQSLGRADQALYRAKREGRNQVRLASESELLSG